MALTETWLYNHKDAELGIDGYKLFRADRKRQKRARVRFSGGVGCYVRLDIASTMEIVVNFSNGVVELLALYSKVHNLYIATIYRQPDDIVGNHRSTDKEFQQAIDKLKTSLSSLPNPSPNVIFCGDFNIPHSSWPLGSATTGASVMEKEMLECISALSNDHFLNQFITNPTHVCGGVLDLLFCNNDSIIHSYNIVQPLRSTSDHFLVEVNTHILSEIDQEEEDKPERSSPFDCLNFHSNDIDWESMSEAISHLVNDANLDNLHPNERLSAYMKIFTEVAFKFVPAKKTSRRGSFTKIPRERRILMRKRRKLLQRSE